MKHVLTAGMICCTFSTMIIHVSAQEGGTLTDFPALSVTTDWPWWRGPQRNGHAAVGAAPPIVWSDSQNVVWKSPIQDRGHSSPTIVGRGVYLTTADEALQTQEVVAFDASTDELLWQTEISRGGLPRTHGKNTHATPSVACDGELLFASFHHHDALQVVALNFDGKIVWNQSLGEFHPKRYEYGYAPSPMPYRNSLIVAAEYDGASFLTALNRRTGTTIWRTPRPVNTSFSTPAILRVGNRDLLALSGAGKVACYDPTDGKPLWAVDGTTAATCGTMVADGDLLFASGGYPKAETVAVRAGVGGGEVVWTNSQKCYEQSMIVADGYLYALTDKGVLYCWKGTDGREMWRERLQGPVSASPVLAGGCIYWSNELGTTYVLKPNPERCELVAQNRLGDESFASPAVVGSRLFLRVATGTGSARQEVLYCLGR